MAAAYYAAQRPHFELAAAAFGVHPYFLGSMDGLSRPPSFYSLMTARTERFAAQVRGASPRDDFRIEKDKCTMQRFLEKRGVPCSPVLASWHNVSLFLDELVSLRLHRNFTASAGHSRRFFAKACHLTQSSAGGVKPIGDEKWVREHSGELAEWATSRSTNVAQSDDYRRPWRLAGNALTFGLQPGFFIQYPFDLSIEIAIEVLWGRPYIGHINMFPLGDVFIHPSPESVSPMGIDRTATIVSNKVLPEKYQFLLRDPAYMACVFRRAQLVACLIGADEVRVDVFVTKASPDGCVVNEISLNDGLYYGQHFPHLAALWAAPYESGSYRVRDNGSVPVYEQSVHPKCLAH